MPQNRGFCGCVLTRVRFGIGYLIRRKGVYVFSEDTCHTEMSHGPLGYRAVADVQRNCKGKMAKST